MKEDKTILGTLPRETFKEFLFQDRKNKVTLWIAVTAIIIQFVLFKYFYPFASFIYGDSFVYLDIARENLDIQTYMVGYGRFLRLFSVFTKSDTALVACQYLMIQSGALGLLFSLYYFYKPGRWVQIVLQGFVVLNPLFLHMANMISSDGFFLSLSLFWFTFLLWIIHRPGIQLVVWHTVFLVIVFTVRYNALIYPIITVFVFLISKLSLRVRIAGTGVALLFCSLFILYTAGKYKALTGIWQYSPFSGWQMANNAMYAYRYVDHSQRKPVPKRFKILDNMICTYFDSTRDVKKHPQEAEMAGTVYMWTPWLPLYKYRDELFKNDTTSTELEKWASMGPFYRAYGIYIVKTYPYYYARYFLMPNVSKYYAPPVEFLAVYNGGYDRVTPQAQQWFDYKSEEVKTRFKNPWVVVLDFFPIWSGVINAMMLFGILGFAILRGFRMKVLFRKGVIIAGIVWLLNAAFTILASSAALRFQAFPIVITSIFSLLLIDWICKMGIIEREKRTPAEKKESTIGMQIG